MIGNIFTAMPGMGTALETLSNEFRWGRDVNGVFAGGMIAAAAVDTGTPTTFLRAGLLLGTITASGKLTNYSATATDGSQIVTGVLAVDVSTLDRSNTAADQFAWILAAGPVKAANLYGLDETARGQMASRFLFDDRGYNTQPSAWAQTLAKTADYTVVNGTDNNTHFTNEGASGTVIFTLPTTITKGQRWRFTATVAAQTLTVTAASGKLITFNNAAATSVTFSTSNQIIGGTFEIVVNAAGTKYIAIPSGSNTVTVA